MSDDVTIPTPLDNWGPAYPCPATGMEDGDTSMSLRAFAAISLQVPASGIPELDAMIRRARRMTATLAILPTVFASLEDTNLSANDVAEELGIPAKDYRYVIHWMMFILKRASKIADAILAGEEKP